MVTKLNSSFMPTALVTFALIGPCFISGCTNDEEDSTPVKPPIAFEGKPDPALAGTWKQQGKESSYLLKEDGNFDYKGKVSTPGGVIDSSFSSVWLVNGDKFLMKDQGGNVSQYKYKLEGKKLTLSRTGSIKLDSVYIKE